MANEIYHRSNWGNAVNDIAWGDTYEKFDATNEMFVRSDNYENSNETDKLMSAINPKPSILLTPTAYDNGSLHSVKPVKTFGSELVTNGDFATDSDWLKGTGWTISGGTASCDGSQSGNSNFSQSNVISDQSKTYRVEFTLSNYAEGSIKPKFGNATQGANRTANGTYVDILSGMTNNNLTFTASPDFVGSIDNVSVKEVTDADFDFTRGSSATRVNEQGLIEDVQILSGELVQNGDFEEIGSELVTNGDFDTDSDWTLESGWSISNGKLLGTLSNSTNAYQPEALEAGKIYQITYEISNYSQGGVRFQFAGGGGTVSGNIKSSNGVFTEELKATVNHTSIRFRSLASDGGFTGSIDNVSVKEVGQNWTLEGGWSVEDGLLVNDGTGVNLSATQSGFFTVGNKYRVSLDVKSITQGSLEIYLGFPQSDIKTINLSGSYTYDIIASGNTTFYIKPLSNFTGSIDNISVIEITDDTNIPRIDYTDGTGSLLLEPQSTNLITYSEDFSSLNIRSNAVVTSNAIVSPSGLLDADEITFDGTYSGRVEQTISSIVGQSYTISLYLKNKDLSDKTQVWIGFSVAAQGSYVTITDEWQRYDITTTADGTSEYPRIQFSGTGSLYAWGFQVEELSYATSYIPTSGSTVTRSADVCDNSGSSDLINSTEGVLYAEILPYSQDGRISLNDGTTNNNVRFTYQASNNTIFGIVYNGSNQCVLTYQLPTENSFYKIAFKYKASDFSLFVNGIEVNTLIGSGTTLTSGTLSGLDFDAGNGLVPFYGNVKSVAVFKEALNNDELERLTGEGYETFNLLAQANNYTII